MSGETRPYDRHTQGTYWNMGLDTLAHTEDTLAHTEDTLAHGHARAREDTFAHRNAGHTAGTPRT